MEFSALNRESSNTSFSTPSSKRKKLTQEAQESICLKMYHDAMKCQQSGEWSKAKEMYCEILESEVMEEACEASEESFQLSTSTIGRLKFLIFKNIASIAREQGDLSAAVDAYIEAASIDASDITVWSQLASLGSSLGNLLLARKALEHALSCQTNHWPAIDALCTVLFALQDYSACLHIISKGLELDDHFPRGLVYLKEIVKEQPELLAHHHLHQLRLHLMSEQPENRTMFLKEAELLHRRRGALNEVVALQEPVMPPKKLSSLTFSSMATCLSSLYKHCKDLSHKESHFLVPIDFSTFIDASCSAPPSPSCKSSPAGKGSFHSETPGSVAQVKPPEEGKEEIKVVVVRREAKRRLLVEGIDPFAPKRRSSRVMTKRKEKEHKNYFDMLSKYIPEWLMLKELPEIAELSPLKKSKKTDEDEESLCGRKQAVSALKSSTPHLAEVEEVVKFMHEVETNSGIVQVAFSFIRFLSLHYNHKWCQQPGPLARSFVDVYRCVHSHLCFPSPFCSPIEAEQENFQQVAMVALCYVELCVDTGKLKSHSQDSCGSTCHSFKECLSFIQHSSGAVGVGPLGKVEFTLRVQWCLGKWYQLCHQQTPAIKALTMCKDLIQVFYVDDDEGPLIVYLPNVTNGPVISLDHVVDRLRTLERSISIKEVEQLHLQKDYSLVVDRLLPIVDQGTSIPTEFLMGTKGQGSESTSLHFLLDSLFFLQRYHDCLETSVCAALQLLQHQQQSSDSWSAAVKNTFIMMDHCLGDEVAQEETLRQAGVRLIRQLVVCLLKVLDCVYDMADSSEFFHTTMPICLPWKMFHVIIASNWSVLKDFAECQVPPAALSSVAVRDGGHMTDDMEEPLVTDTVRDDSRGKEQPSDMEDMEVAKEEEVVRSTPTPPPLPCHVSSSSPSPLLHCTTKSSLSTETKPLPAREAMEKAAGTSECRKLSPLDEEERNKEDWTTCSGESGSDVTGGTDKDRTPTLREKLTLPVCSETPSPSVSIDSTSSPSTTTSSLVNEDSDVCGLDEKLTPPLDFLLEAHRHLGRMGWCCKQSGTFLKHSVQALRKELAVLTKLPVKQREVLLLELEQCYYCLYGHPNKKARTRGLSDHNTEQIPLTWESALMLIHHYHPLSLPSIDNIKPQVSAEVVSLYKRVIDVLPEHSQVLSKDSLEEFIEDGQADALSKTAPPHQDSSIIAGVYYILADDALRSMDNAKAIKYYLETICYSPDRFDSWAGLALGRSRLILDKLNLRDIKSTVEKFVRKHCAGAVACFKKAVSLNTNHCSIIEKFGFFCYTVQSYASQILRQPSLFILTGVHSWAESTHREMQLQAKECFTMALELGRVRNAEPWIYHWMLGKLGKKLNEPAREVMSQLVKSAVTLYQDGACYPDLVEISSKDHSVEALEVHYQIHSFALKFLLPFHHDSASSVDPKENVRSVVEEAISNALSALTDIPLSTQCHQALQQWVCNLVRYSPGKLAHQKEGEVGLGEAGPADCEVGEMEVQNSDLATGQGSCDQSHYLPQEARSGDQSCDLSERQGSSNQSYIVPEKSGVHKEVNLLQRCFYGVGACAVRFPAFFKPLYRMAATLLDLGHPQEAKALLLGPLPDPLLLCQDRLQPLFVLKTNIFTNMWQVRFSEEVNRPGSFSTHARRSLELLVRILVTLRDAKLLLQVAQLLKSRPDSNKQYLRENERLAMHKKIVRECVKVLMEVSQQEDMSSSEALQFKSVATTVRSMASRLEKKLIENLDSVLERLQCHIIVEEDPIAPVAANSSYSIVPEDRVTPTTSVTAGTPVSMVTEPVSATARTPTSMVTEPVSATARTPTSVVTTHQAVTAVSSSQVTCKMLPLSNVSSVSAHPVTSVFYSLVSSVPNLVASSSPAHPVTFSSGESSRATLPIDPTASLGTGLSLKPSDLALTDTPKASAQSAAARGAHTYPVKTDVFSVIAEPKASVTTGSEPFAHSVSNGHSSVSSGPRPIDSFSILISPVTPVARSLPSASFLSNPLSTSSVTILGLAAPTPSVPSPPSVSSGTTPLQSFTTTLLPVVTSRPAHSSSSSKVAGGSILDLCAKPIVLDINTGATIPSYTTTPSSSIPIKTVCTTTPTSIQTHNQTTTTNNPTQTTPTTSTSIFFGIP